MKQQEVFRKKPLASKDDFSNELLVFCNKKKNTKKQIKAEPKADYPTFSEGPMYINFSSYLRQRSLFL